MRQDEVLFKIAERVKRKSPFRAGRVFFVKSATDIPVFAVIYLCDIDEVPEFNTMYELFDPMTIMFFYRNKHMMCDFGTGNNNKLNWVLEDKQELIDIIETIYKGAKKGRGLVVSPKGEFSFFVVFCCCRWLMGADYSTRYRY
jgi:DIM1 family U5 snRNP protein